MEKQKIKILVTKTQGGYNFTILPSTINLIKSIFQDAHPVSSIFVTYDTKDDFDYLAGNLEQSLYPVLIGTKAEDIEREIDEILFVDTLTQKNYALSPSTEKHL